MKKKKHIIPLILLILGTLLLGVSTLVISLQLQNRQPVTDLPPKAAEGDTPSSTDSACLVTIPVAPLSTCEISFSLSTPSPTQAPTCGASCTSDSQCPTNHRCVTTTGDFQNKCVLDICFDDPTSCTTNRCSPKETAVITPTCGGNCTADSQCPTDHRCVTTSGEFQNKCVLNACYTDPASCTSNRCSVKATTAVTPTCGGSCTSDSQCPTDHRCITTSGEFQNKCVLNACYTDPASCTSNRCSVKTTTTVTTTITTTVTTTAATNTPTQTPTRVPTTQTTLRPTNTPAPGLCSASCTDDSDCANNLICSGGMCRNQECTQQANCLCSTTPTPEIPVTGMGTTIAGIGIIAGGILLLLLGLVF